MENLSNLQQSMTFHQFQAFKLGLTKKTSLACSAQVNGEESTHFVTDVDKVQLTFKLP